MNITFTNRSNMAPYLQQTEEQMVNKKLISAMRGWVKITPVAADDR